MFEISRTALTLFGVELRWYGILIAVGMLLGVWLASVREKKMGLPKDVTLDLALAALPAALICARAYYVIFSWDYYAAHPEEIIRISNGGMAIYGGVIGGVLAGLICCKIKKLSFAACLDLTAPSIALGQAIGRWGNFLNQEAYGREVARQGLQFFPAAVWIEGSGWHYATFFYESIWCAIIVALILSGERRGFFRRRGDAFGAYLLLYALERTLVEGLRTDSLYIGGLRVSQVLSLAVLAGVSILLCLRERGAVKPLRALPLVDVGLFAAAIYWGNTALTLTAALLLPALTFALYYNAGSHSSTYD